jgi:probable rRNA maturation factor
MMDLLSIKNLTRSKAPKLPFEEIKNKVLGNKYELSLVFIGSTRSRKLNLTYRDKDKPANVLSFPLTKSSGEIFIDLNKTKTFSTLHLFIHGLLHLKGMQHGGKMESEEQRLLKLFNGQTHFRRHRHR